HVLLAHQVTGEFCRFARPLFGQEISASDSTSPQLKEVKMRRKNEAVSLPRVNTGPQGVFARKDSCCVHLKKALCSEACVLALAGSRAKSGKMNAAGL